MSSQVMFVQYPLKMNYVVIDISDISIIKRLSLSYGLNNCKSRLIPKFKKIFEFIKPCKQFIARQTEIDS